MLDRASNWVVEFSVGEASVDDNCDVDIVFLDNLGNEVCDGVLIEVGHEPDEVVFSKITSLGDGERLALLAVLEADAGGCVIAGFWKYVDS